ncbi:endonuclease/exonuclease/phosphatase family protein [Nocardioides ultimimeridianus]
MPGTRIAALSVRLTTAVVVALSVVISAPATARDAGTATGTTAVGDAPRTGAVANLRVVTFNTDFAVSRRRWVAEMDRAAGFAPDVLLVQEVQWRDRLIRRWARREHYRLWYGRNDEHQESDVLLRSGRRFDVRSVRYRLGSGAVTRANGDRIHARYIQTVRVRDRRSGRRLAFSTTHVVPEVMWWPREGGYLGAPDPFRIQPRYGTATLSAARAHYERVRRQLRADLGAGYLPVVGGDFNAGAQYEPLWSGFMTEAFGGFMTSNHEALGRVTTEEDPVTGDRRSIDYVWAPTGPVVRFRDEHVRSAASDHDIIVVDLSVEHAG